MKYGNWEYKRSCKYCKSRLSDDQVYYSGGVCPECGADSKSTICDYEKIIYRKVYTNIPQWFEFWKSPTYTIEILNQSNL